VFRNDNRLQELQDLVWQNITISGAFHKKKVEEYGKEGVVVVEVVLLKAEWDHFVQLKRWG